MTRHSDNDTAQVAREAELSRRVRALNRYVLGDPDRRETNRDRMMLCLAFLFVLALVLWIILLFDLPTDADAGDTRAGGALPMLALAILVKLFGATLLILCVLMRFWLLAAVNLGLVAAFLTMTALGVFDPHPKLHPELPIEAPVDAHPADKPGGTDR